MEEPKLVVLRWPRVLRDLIESYAAEIWVLVLDEEGRLFVCRNERFATAHQVGTLQLSGATLACARLRTIPGMQALLKPEKKIWFNREEDTSRLTTPQEGSTIICTRNGQVYRCGGVVDGSLTSRFECLCPDGTWQKGPRMRKRRSHSHAVLLDQRFVVVLGGMSPARLPRRDVEMIDLLTTQDGWSVQAPMIIPRSGRMDTVVEGLSFLLSGGSSHNLRKTIERYSLNDNSWIRVAWNLQAPLSASWISSSDLTSDHQRGVLQHRSTA